MQRGKDWTTIAKVVVGGLLIGAGGFLAFQGNKTSSLNGYNVSIAHAAQGNGNQSTYCAKWQANKLITIDTTTLKIADFTSTSSKKFFAIGPQEWDVTYTTGSPDGSGNCNGTPLAVESWTAPTPPACYTGTACTPSGAAAHQYLYGLVAPATNPGINADYANMAFTIKNWDDIALYGTTNPRFVGPGAVGDTNNNSNVEGYNATGAYGWEAGAIDGNSATGGRDYREAVGIMMPLQWTVSGTLYAN